MKMHKWLVLLALLLGGTPAFAGTALITGTGTPATHVLNLLNPANWAADSVTLCSEDGVTWGDYNGMADGVGMADAIGNTTVGTLGTITMVLTGAVPAGTFAWFDVSKTTGYDDPNRFMAAVITATGVGLEFGTKVDGVSCGTIPVATVAGAIGVAVESVPADSKFIVSYTANGTDWTPVDVTYQSITDLACVGTVGASTAIRVKGPASYGCDWGAGWPCTPLPQATLDSFLVESGDISGDAVFGPAASSEGEGEPVAEGEGEPTPPTTVEIGTLDEAVYWDKWGWWWGQGWSVGNDQGPNYWAAFDVWGAFAAGTGDVTQDGIPDRFQLGMVCAGLANSIYGADVNAALVANHNALMAVGQGAWWGVPVTMGFFATISQEWCDAIEAQWPIVAGQLHPYTQAGAKTASEPLSPSGDFDGDGISNLDEYSAAMNPAHPLTNPDNDALTLEIMRITTAERGTWPFIASNSENLPVAGVFGLSILAVALGGLSFARRKRG